jgi:hypothetical protein
VSLLAARLLDTADAAVVHRSWSFGVMQTAAQITTVLPTYRRPALLKRAMMSVLEQDFAALRLCVFDNASGDETANVVSAIARADTRIRYHRHPENIGGPANFDFGLRQVETPFFSILSDDDYLLPGFYCRALADLEQHPEAMFWAGVTLNVDESGKIWDARVARWSREGLFKAPEGVLNLTGGMSPTWTGIVFRRAVLDTIGYPDTATLGPSDLEFIVKIAAAHPYLVFKQPAAVFTLNSASFSSTQPLSSFWPGWKKMLANVHAFPGLDPLVRAELLSRLRFDAHRMLFRRGANALAQGRLDFARDAAAALDECRGQWLQASLLRVIASVCDSSKVARHGYALAYSAAERRIIASRASLQAKFGALLRSE